MLTLPSSDLVSPPAVERLIAFGLVNPPPFDVAVLLPPAEPLLPVLLLPVPLMIMLALLTPAPNEDLDDFLLSEASLYAIGLALEWLS
jgi:hypothetical protein